MGVSGCGKTSVGQVLSASLGWVFFDGDAYHPRANTTKMAAGQPLTDHDRIPWLKSLRQLLAGQLKNGRSVVLACSALKRSYRAELLDGNATAQFVYLRGDFNLIHERMTARSDHYMDATMLKGQFEIFEEPAGAIVIDADQSVESIVEEIIVRLETCRA